MDVFINLPCMQPYDRSIVNCVYGRCGNTKSSNAINDERNTDLGKLRVSIPVCFRIGVLALGQWLNNGSPVSREAHAGF